MFKNFLRNYLVVVIINIFASLLFVSNHYSVDVIAYPLDLVDIPGPYRFESVCLVNKNELWSVGGGGEIHFFNIETSKSMIYKLEDKSLFNGDFYGIYFNENGNGWAVGDNGVIFHTANNGANWKLQQSNVKENKDLQAITCVNDNCWTVGEEGTVLVSDNKGEKWKIVDLKADENLKDVFFINEKIGWIIGSEGGIWKTVDGGNNWSFQELKIENEYAHSLSIKFQNEQKGWISGFDFVARTEDGGKTWQITELDGKIIGIVTQDGEKIWAIRRGGNYCSKDAGKTWRECCVDMK